MSGPDDQRFMESALSQAASAELHGDVPIGAVVVMDGREIGSDHNRRELEKDPTAHAEILALRAAAGAVGRWNLSGATLYSTLEPCPMCAGALVNARISRLVFGAWDPKAGATGSLYNLCADPRLNHELVVDGGFEAERCSAQLRDFFSRLRESRNSQA